MQNLVPPPNRRQFLGASLIGALAVLLDACSSESNESASPSAGSELTTGEPADSSSGSTAGSVDLPDTSFDELVAQQGDLAFADIFETVAEANNVGLISSGGPYTIFAPSAEAIASGLSALLAGGHLPLITDQVVAVAQGHVVQGAYLAADLAGTSSLTSIDGEAIAIGSSGSSVTIDDATVVASNLTFSGGVIHLIDRLLLPSDLAAPGQPTAPPADSLTGIIESEPSLRLLAAGISAPAFTGVLDVPQITVFAPNDAAMLAEAVRLIGAGVPTDMNQVLQVGLSHVVPEILDAATLSTRGGQTLSTLAGTQLAIDTSGSDVTVGGARVISTLAGSSGVVHVVDAVLTSLA